MKAISSMATRHLLGDLASASASAGLPPVQVESVGGVDAAQRVAAGEPFDLVFLAADALTELAAGGHVEAASVTPLVLSQVAVAVPADTREPAWHDGGAAFTSADGVRAALCSSDHIGYSTGPSGIALLQTIREWDLMDAVGERLIQARPGVPVARLLADGEVDLGFQQLSELVGQPAIRILGVLPGDCAIETEFGGAVASAAPDPGLAHRVLEFFTSERVDPIKSRHSFSVPSRAARRGTYS